MIDKNKKKLEKLVKEEVTNFFEEVLNYTQIACAEPNTFKVLRSRILRLGNDCIRDIISGLNDYDVKYIPKREEIIEIINNK